MELLEITGYEAIPDEMKAYPNWVVYKKEIVKNPDDSIKVDENGEVKYTKIPYNPKTNSKARTTDPSTWADFNTALAKDMEYDGLGFVLTNSPFVGVDLDNVGNEIKAFYQGDTNNIVGEFHEALQTYMEISPSGNGVHLILKGELPQGGNRAGNIEMYDTGRYFTVTGEQLGEYDLINPNGSNLIKPLHNKYLGNKTQSKNDIPIPNPEGNSLTIEELTKKASNAKNGDKFKALFFDGDTSQHNGDDSAADLALINIMWWWTNGDPDKADEWFRQSALMRDKWDELRGEHTYGIITHKEAWKSFKGGYTGKKKTDFNLNIKQTKGKSIEEIVSKTQYCSWDDTGNAERFKTAFGDEFLYNTTAQEWYTYDEKVWQPDSLLKAETCATAITEIMKHEPLNTSPNIDEKELEKLMEAKDKFISKTRNHVNKMNMLKSARSLLPATEESFNNGGNVINLQNGYYDLDNDEFKGHNPEMMFTLISNATYEPEAECPLWEQFIYDSFLGNADLIEYVQRAIGYSISNSTAERLIFFLFGQETGTGKSVLTNVLDELLGTYSQNIKPEALMVDRNKTGESADPSFAKLKGARLVTTSESNESGKIDEGLIKRLTGGDKITARFLHKNEITYTPEFKIWMATNYKPIVQNNDSAIWQRLVVIPMDNVVPASKADVNLTNKLKAEINGILNWAIEGYRMYKKHGLRKSEPDAIKSQRNSYHNEMDIVGRFIDECCMLDSQASVKSSDIWDVYKIWCEGNNEHAGTIRKFSIELEKRFEKEKKSDGRYFLGIDFIK